MHKSFVLLIILLSIILTSGVPSFAVEKSSADQELNQELKWLRAEAVVFTASKHDQKIDSAPAVMTVYTRDEIENQGLRNLGELLDRTAGFFTSRNVANPLVGSRGIFTGENEPYLLLIDGHKMNSIVDKGPGDFSLFPLLSMVKRVEIVRGPGSTLWGSDAALGIVHLITMDGKDIGGFKATADYASEDNYKYANILYGEGNGQDKDIMLSFTYAQSDGYPKGGFSPDPVWGDMKWGPMDRINDSWELYGKVRQNNFTFSGQASDLMDSRLLDSQFNTASGDIGKAKYNRRRHFSLDLDHKKDLSKTASLETKVFSDLIERWQQAASPLISPDLNLVDDSFLSKESTLGLELVLRMELFDSHKLLSGIQIVQTEIDPVYLSALFPLEGNTKDTEQHSLLVVPDQRDRNLAAYVEDDWAIMSNLHLIAGLRADNNNLREKNTKVLPRIACIWGMNNAWTLKYMYNTGYVRPPVAKGFLGQRPMINQFYYDSSGNLTYGPLPNIGVSKSEDVQSHDVNLSYNAHGLQTGLTAYYTRMDNLFNLLGKNVNIDGKDYSLLYVNSNKIKSFGIELDIRQRINDSIDWYGNYSHIISAEIDKFNSSSNGIDYSLENTYLFADNKKLTQFPGDIWNLGINLGGGCLGFSRQASLNIHLRGWKDVWAEIQESPGQYEKLGPENFVDTNLRFKNAFLKGLDISVYGKNIFDNTKAACFLPLAGRWPPRGRSVGMQLTYKM